jgi:MFS family permease
MTERDALEAGFAEAERSGAGATPRDAGAAPSNAETVPGEPRPPASLWRHADFSKLWFGQAVSGLGSQVTVLALPLTAVLYLKASAIQVGWMTSAAEFAFFGPALFFGVMVDRMRRRPVMVGADISRAAVLALVPILAWTGSLSMWMLYVIALTHSCLTVIFELAYRSYLPSLITAEHLLVGNSRLQATDSISQVAGPGLGGALVQLMRAPSALLIDAGSFLVSAASVLSIRAHEPAVRRDPDSSDGVRGGVLREIGSGLRFILRHPVLRSLAGAGATFNFFSQIQLTLLVLYAAREMHLSAGEIGIVYAGFGVGGVLAATTLGRALAWFGYGRLLVLGYVMGALGIIGLPFVAGSASAATSQFVGLYFLAGSGIVALNIVSMTLRQVATPSNLQARVNASFRVSISGLMPVSAVIAGILGDHLGLRIALFIAAGGMPLSVSWVALSPARAVTTLAQLASSGYPGDGKSGISRSE